MVVDDLDANSVVVAWRDGEGIVREAVLPLACLAKVLISN